MDITQAYTITVGGIFLTLFFFNYFSNILQIIRLVLYIVKQYIYLYILRCHRFLRLWTWVNIFFQLIYIMLNVICIIVQVSTVWQAGLWAEIFSLINIISLFTGLHYGFLADLFRISLNMYQYFYQSACLMLFFLTFFHVFTSYSLLAKTCWFELMVNTDKH